MKVRVPPAILLVLSGLVFLVSAFMLLSSRGGATPVSIDNRSGFTLESVVVYGSGYRASVREIPPAASSRIYVYPDGESGLAVAFKANGHEVSTPSTGYIEGGGGYSLTVVIDSNLDASLVYEDSTLHELFKFL